MRQQGSDLRPDMSLQAELLHGEMKASSAIYAVAIEQRHCGHLVRVAGVGEFLGDGGSFEETECRAGVEFDVHSDARASPLSAEEAVKKNQKQIPRG